MGSCLQCINWSGQADMEEALCSFLNVKTRPKGCCPGFRTLDMSDSEYEEQQQEARVTSNKTLAMLKQKPKPSKPPATPSKSTATPTKNRRKAKIEPVLVRYDPDRPVLEPFGHQLEAYEKFKDKDEIALFFEMGCGKSFTTLYIAQKKFEAGLIKGLLVVAPNDVHRQWYDELVNGVDKEHDGVLWQELSIDFEAQCVGGRGGQKELYPFETEDLFKFVSVNVDTFSQPHKWEEIVFWANGNNYAIAIDEATVIKNPSSKRSQRLLYEFNDVVKRGKRIISSEKKHPVRFVLTGTPVTNGPIDLWAIMEFVRPNYFNRNYYSFRAYYGMFTRLSVMTAVGTRDIDVMLTEKTWQAIHDCESYQAAYILFGCSEDTYMTVKHQDKFVGPYKHADELRALLEPVSIFKKLTDCVDMPSVNYIMRHVGMSDIQKATYMNMKNSMLSQYSSYLTVAKNKLVINLRLQQISSGFIMARKAGDSEQDVIELLAKTDRDDLVEQLDDQDIMPSEVVWLGESCPKLDALMRDVAECDKPLLILTRYSAEAAKIFELCENAGYKTGLFTGWKVVGGIDEFKNGNLDILVANSSKISKGFNLQIAHTTLFYSNTFSMETRQQAEFRTFRMGQKHPCLYIDYSAAEVDDTINTALQMKKGLLEYIRDKNIEEVI